MSNENSLIPGEKLLRKMRPHWNLLILPVLAAAALTYSYFWVLPKTELIPSPFRDVAFWITTGIYVLLLLKWTVKGFIDWLTTTYTFTNQRIMTQTGWLKITGETIALDRIHSVQFSRTILERLLGSGSLIIESAAENRITIKNVWQAEQVHKEIYAQIAKNNGTDEEEKISFT